MKGTRTPPGEEYQIRCPRLGHQISFSYCRSENGGLPCFKTLECWHPHFPVEAFLREELTPEQWDRAFCERPRAKMPSLIALIEEAKERNRKRS